MFADDPGDNSVGISVGVSVGMFAGFAVGTPVAQSADDRGLSWYAVGAAARLTWRLPRTLPRKMPWLVSWVFTVFRNWPQHFVEAHGLSREGCVGPAVACGGVRIFLGTPWTSP